jgi:hypothetical protein
VKVAFCQLCGRVVLKSFLYCPYCGAAMRVGPDAERVCTVFDKLEQRQAQAGSLRIDRLIAALDAIETDLETLMHDDVSSAV